MFTGQFGNAANTVAANLRTLIVDDRYTVNGEVLDWDSVKEGDYLTLTPQQAFSDDLDNFGFYKVKRNLVKYFIQGGSITDKINEQNCFQLEYLGGNDTLSIRQGFEYDIRVMDDLATNLADDFVQRSGDTMTGDLIIESPYGIKTVSIDTSEDSDLTINRKNTPKIIIGEDKTTHDQKSTYIQTAADTVGDPLDLVHAQYVDDKITAANQELDDLNDQLDILNNRIEAVAKILEQYEFVCAAGRS